MFLQAKCVEEDVEVLGFKEGPSFHKTNRALFPDLLQYPSMRILAIATNPEAGASTRFRVLQWAPYLRHAGFSLSLDTFFSTAGAAVLYEPGRRLSKFAYFLSGSLRRVVTLIRAASTADLLFIHREAFPLGQKVLFSRLQRFPGPIVYDFDDAMFLPQRQDRGILAKIEGLETPKEVMALSKLVLAGNRFLADYAEPHASRVIVFPTCIDTEKFRPPEERRPSDKCVVGWIGSHSTAKYLRSLMPILEQVACKYQFDLHVVGCPMPVYADGLKITQAPWSLEREVADFCRCDVGVYPLWGDPWAQGKCGFKAIQFMACGVPVVAAAVGVNREIIEDGVNGFLAATEQEWIDKLGWLVSDPHLRGKLGQAGRQTVEKHYSLAANASKLIFALQEAVRHAPQAN